MTTTKKLKAQGLTGGPQLTIWEGGAAYPAEAAWGATTASTTAILAKLLGPSSERVCESLTGAYTDLRSLATAHPVDLHAIGFSSAAIERLAVLVEFAKRFGEQEFLPGTPFRGSADIYGGNGRYRSRTGPPGPPFTPAPVFRRMRPMTTAATSRAEVIQRCQQAEPEIRRLGVRRIALFGSLARGEATAHSDVDLLVEFEPGGKSFDRFLALAELLERILGRRVDLVTTEALSPYIGPHILAEAADVVRAA